jgi:membrane-associated protein
MFDVTGLIQAFGLIGVTFIIFAESGLFFGFFLPGDSILFTAGILASQGFFNISILVFCVWIAAVSGDTVGYWFGARIGIKIFNKEKSVFFNKKYPERAHEFYVRHGKKAIILARFIPAVRTFVPIMAGVGKMSYRNFISYNIIGGTIWAIGLTLGGYFLGQSVSNIDQYIIPIIVLIIVTSVIPIISEVTKPRGNQKN